MRAVLVLPFDLVTPRSTMKLFSLMIGSVLSLGFASAEANGPVLILGDERVEGRFGQLLEQKLLARDGTVSARVSACGLGVNDWLMGAHTNCGYLEKKVTGEITQKKESDVAPFITYLSDAKPEFVVFVHGKRGLDTTPKALQAQIALMGRLLSASKVGCLWMGPGDDVGARVSDAYYGSIQDAAIQAGCVVIDAPLFASLWEEDPVRNLDPVVEIVSEMLAIGRNL